MACLSDYRAKHLGERCFVVGNGPSLNWTPLDLMNNDISFGVNRIPKHYPVTTWRPTYYVNVHTEKHGYGKIVDKDLPLIKIARDEGAVCFVGCDLEGTIKLPLRRVGTVPKELTPLVWSPDIERYLIVKGSGTVIWAVMHLVEFMGFQEVYFVGCDLDYQPYKSGDKDPNHFTDNYEGHDRSEKYNQYVTSKTLMAFTYFKDIMDLQGRKAYNATLGGKLEVLERVDYYSLF